jgi:CelD/BcsL family acetyltransferase involved in cellulose biosynthesis
MKMGDRRSTELCCEIVTAFDRLEELSAGWQCLWQADATAEIFQSFAWARAWWQCFGNGLKLCTPVVYANHEPLLILPLVQRGDTIRFLGSPQSDYCDVLCPETRTAELLAVALQALVQSFPGWKECIFRDLPSRGRMARHWHELPPELRGLLRLKRAYTCPTILFEGRRNEVLDPLLAKKHLRRRLNKLEKAGRLSFRHIETTVEAQEQLTQFIQCHRRRCALLAKSSAFEAEETRRFLRVLAEQLDLRNQLRFGVLELDGRPLAWSLGFHVNGKFAFYQQTFDMDAADYAPGEVLLYHLLLYAKDNIQREFDFARGDEFFKSRFATDTLQSWSLYFVAPGVQGRLRWFREAVQDKLQRLRVAVERAIRDNDLAFRAFRRFRVWKSRQLSRIRHARQNATLPEYFAQALASLLRTTIWSRDDIILFRMESSPLPKAQGEDRPSHPKLEITAGRLSDLLDLLIEHPEMAITGITECRNRLKSGDQIFLVRQKGQVALAAWCGTRGLSELLSLKHGSEIMLDAPALVLYECWPVLDFDPAPSYWGLFTFLESEAVDKNLSLLVCCSATQRLVRAELEKRGFLPVCHIVRHRFFHWLRHESIRSVQTA